MLKDISNKLQLQMHHIITSRITSILFASFLVYKHLMQQHTDARDHFTVGMVEVDLQHLLGTLDVR